MAKRIAFSTLGWYIWVRHLFKLLLTVRKSDIILLGVQELSGPQIDMSVRYGAMHDNMWGKRVLPSQNEVVMFEQQCSMESYWCLAMVIDSSIPS
jgi:hypothetical protein